MDKKKIYVGGTSHISRDRGLREKKRKGASVSHTQMQGGFYSHNTIHHTHNTQLERKRGRKSGRSKEVEREKKQKRKKKEN